MTGLAGSRSSARLPEDSRTEGDSRRSAGPSLGSIVGAACSAIPPAPGGRTDLAHVSIQMLAQALARWEPFGFGTDPFDYCELPAQGGSGVEVWFRCPCCGGGRNPTQPGPARIVSSVAWECVECGAEGTRDWLERVVLAHPRALRRLAALWDARDR